MTAQFRREQAGGATDNPIAKDLGPAIMAAASFAVTWLTAGYTDIKPALTALAADSRSGNLRLILVTSLLYWGYFGILALSSAREMSPKRLAFKLWYSVAEGERPAVLYARWLIKFLDGVDWLLRRRRYGRSDIMDSKHRRF